MSYPEGAIYVELPEFSPSDTGAGRRSTRNRDPPRNGQPARSRSRSRSRSHERGHRSGGHGYADDQGVVQLSDVNPFGESHGRSGTRGGPGARGGRGTAALRRGTAHVVHRRPPSPQRFSDEEEVIEDEEEEGGITVLSNVDPFRNGGRNGHGGHTLSGGGTRHPNPPAQTRRPVSMLSASDDEEEEEDHHHHHHHHHGAVRQVLITEPSPPPSPRPRFSRAQEREPEAYADGEPTPNMLSAVGPNGGVSGPGGRLASAVGRAKMMNALGGGSKKGPETAQSPETLSEGSAVLVGGSGTGKAPAAGERAGEPSHHHGPHAHLHGSNVPLRSSETERVYVPFTDEVIRDVKRHRHHPKIPYPGYPGYPNYPPYYPYPYPYPYEAEYSDVSDDEHRHHHHHRPHSRHRYESEREHEHHHHHGRHHPHHSPFYPPPPWFDPFHPGPVHPHNQAYNPAPPTHQRIPFSGPLYASIPTLSNTFDQNRSAFYSLPVPPTALLRDLQEARAMQVPAEPTPAARAAPNPADRQEFLKGFEYLCSETDMLKGLPVLAYQECQAFYIDAVYRRLSDLVQVRFAERRGDDIINRVHLVQRNRLAFGTVMQYRPKLDIDLVLPGDYMLRRWVVDTNAPADEKPRTIAKAFKLDAASVHRGEIDAKDLGWTIKAVLAQLNGSVDQYIFPGGTSEAGKYLGSFDSSATAEGTNRIRLMTVDPSPVRVNVFIKVAIEVGGQEMVVGVDQASAVSAGKYQMVKLIRQPNGPLGESPVSSIERSALIALGWWKRGVVQGDVPSKTPPGKPKLRASHFGIALKALHALDPSDELYVPYSKLKTQAFGFALVADVMWKVASFLKRSYESPILIAAATGATTAGPNGLAATAEYMFPLSSCGTMEALYTQVASNAGEIDTLKGSGVLDDLIAFLQPRRPTGGAATSTTPAAASATTTTAATATTTPAATTTTSGGGSGTSSAVSNLITNANVSLDPKGVTVTGGAANGSNSLAGGVRLGQQGVEAANLNAATEQGAVAGAVSTTPGGAATANVDVKSDGTSGGSGGASTTTGGAQPAATGSG